MALLEARSGVAIGEALIAQVWPDRVVTENALQVQISASRAVFGAERELIRTVSGRGYQFTGEFSLGTTSRDAHADVSEEIRQPQIGFSAHHFNWRASTPRL